MTTSVTINLPVTATFDGCFCSKECKYNDQLSHRCCLDMRYEHLGRPALEIRDTLSNAFGRWQNYFGSDTRRKDELHKNYIHLHSRLHSIQEMLWMNEGTLGFSSVRTRWCCETFGMGEEQDAQPDKTTHRCALCGRERDYELRKYALCSHCEPEEWEEHPMDGNPQFSPTVLDKKWRCAFDE